MTYAFVLALHLISAAVTGLIIAFALYAAARERSDAYRRIALALGSIAAFEVLTGTALALVSPELSAASLSLHIAGYLGVCAIVESLLFVRMQRISLAFPLRMTLAPALASAVMFVAAVSSGF